MSVTFNYLQPITSTNKKRMDFHGGWWFHRDFRHCTLRIAGRDHPDKKKKKGKADGLSTPPVIFHINSCRTVLAKHRHLHGEETLRGRLFFFQIFYRDCFHRRSRDSGKWRGIASDVFYNDPRSASGSGRAGFLFAREDFWILFRREDPVSFDSGGNVFKEFLIFRIFLFFITEFGCSGKLQS